MVEEDDPVDTDGQVTYTLSWGLDDLADPLTAGRLRFMPPAGATIEVVSGGGVIEARDPGLGRREAPVAAPVTNAA